MFCACSIKHSPSVGDVSSDTPALPLSNSMMSFLAVSITQIFVSPRLCIVSIAISGRSSLSGFLPSALVSKCDSATAAWCLMPAL